MAEKAIFFDPFLRLMKEHLLKFITQHLETKSQDLALALQSLPIEERKWVIAQIESRRKAQYKIKAWQGKEIFFPHDLAIEQCSSDHAAEFKAQIFTQQAKVLDLTMGLGVDSYFFAINNKHVTAVEPNPDAYACAIHNFGQLNVNNITIINQTAEDFLKSQIGTFDMVFVDPSRRNETGGKVFALADCTPNLVEILPMLLEIAPKVMVKLSPMLDVTQALRELHQPCDVYAISFNNDCKELLLVFDEEQKTKNKIAVELNTSPIQQFRHVFDTEKPIPNLGKPSKYLYLPHSSVLKLNLQDQEAQSFGLQKLAFNTQAYTSDSFVPEYMGRKLEIIATISPTEKELKQVLPDGKISLLAKNFPLDTAALRKKLRNEESDNYFGLACTLFNGEKKLIVCKKS